ncbi:hypothetical protein ACWEN6_06940 [Sphaerisporangium sp. NPDC004334]
MLSSISIRGMLAVAAVAAGAGLLGTGSASAATSCEESAVAVLRSQGATSAACEAMDAVAVPQAAVSSLAARHDRDDLIIGFEHIGRSRGLPSRTAAVIGLHDLPAIARATGWAPFGESALVYRAVRGWAASVPGLPRPGDLPMRRGGYAADEPTAPEPLMPVEPALLPARVSAHSSHGLDVELGRTLTVDTTIDGPHAD